MGRNDEFRQKYDVDPFRQHLRDRFPKASDGFVAGDIDQPIYVVRKYGENYHLDPIGDLMLIERKEHEGVPTEAQKRIQKWVETAIGSGNYRTRWKGCHIIHLEYATQIPVCERCGQKLIDKEEAQRIWAKGVRIRWDGDIISTEDLDRIIGGNPDG